MKKVLLAALIFASFSLRAELNENELQQYNALVLSLQENNVSKANVQLSKMFCGNFDFKKLTQQEQNNLKSLAKNVLRHSMSKVQVREDRIKHLLKLWMLYGILCGASLIVLDSSVGPLAIWTMFGSFITSGICLGASAFNVVPYCGEKIEKARSKKIIKLLRYIFEDKAA